MYCTVLHHTVLPCTCSAPLMMAVGSPIQVPHIAPGQPGFAEAVDAAHEQLVQGLVRLYDKHKVGPAAVLLELCCNAMCWAAHGVWWTCAELRDWLVTLVWQSSSSTDSSCDRPVCESSSIIRIILCLCFL